jgi:hypothetical protein
MSAGSMDRLLQAPLPADVPRLELLADRPESAIDKGIRRP